MTLPNFLIIGAAKAGTTALAYYLKQHPDIFMSDQKELKFFAFEGGIPVFRGPGDEQFSNAVTSLCDYEACFAEVRAEKAIGEASPLYLYSPAAAERIRHYVPGARLIAVLRDPARRAYSQFLHMMRDGFEPLGDFRAALLEEQKRIEAGWGPLFHYRKRGFYYEQLTPYYERFPGQQIRVYLYADFVRDAMGLVRDAFRFLGVDETFIPDKTVRPNISGIPRSRMLQSALRGRYAWLNAVVRAVLPKRLRVGVHNVLRRKNLTRPPLDPEVRRDLIREYRDDILRLQDLLDRDLSAWLEVQPGETVEGEPA